MKKKIILSFIFLLCIFTFFNVYETQATSVSDFDTITREEVEASKITTEGKIMKYDAKTNTATEVNMDEVRQILKNKDSRSYNATSTPSYIPKLVNRYNLLNPYSARTSYYSRINDTSVFPYTTISKITSSGGSGSGTVIGQNLVITVAHVVMDGNCAIYNDLTIMPGYNERT